MKTKIQSSAGKTENTYRKIFDATHLKIWICLFLIPMIISFSIPFLSTSAELSLQGETRNSNKNVELISPQDEILSVSLWDLLSHKELDEYKIYGTKIKDYRVFGISIYSVISTPLPNYDVVNQINNFINSDAVKILDNPDVKNLLRSNFGDIGSSIADVIDSLFVYIDNVRAATLNIKNISDAVRVVSDTFIDNINQINEVKTNIEWASYAIPGLAIIGCILLFIRKKPTIVPAIIFTLLFSTMVCIGIGTIIINNIIDTRIQEYLADVNSVVSKSLDTYIPDLQGILGLFGAKANICLHVHMNLQAGYYLILITSAVMAILSYIMFVRSRYDDYIDKKYFNGNVVNEVDDISDLKVVDDTNEPELEIDPLTVYGKDIFSHEGEEQGGPKKTNSPASSPKKNVTNSGTKSRGKSTKNTGTKKASKSKPSKQQAPKSKSSKQQTPQSKKTGIKSAAKPKAKNQNKKSSTKKSKSKT